MDSFKRLLMGGALTAVWLAACAFSPATMIPGGASDITASASLPDLAVTALTISPEMPSAGDTVTISVTVQNIGESSAPSCLLTYLIDEKQIATNVIDSLGPNAKTDLILTWKAQGGSHVLRVVADFEKAVDEAFRDNNSKSFAFSVIAPDLAITSISWTPANPAMGDNVTITVRVANEGNQRARSCQLDFSIDGVSRGYRTLLPLDPGAMTSEIYNWPVLSGNHTIVATADALLGVSESDKTNNRMEVMLVTALPDLIVSSIALESNNGTIQNIVSGDSININVFVKNRGTGRAAPSQVACYIDDNLIGTSWIGYLASGESTNWTFSWRADENLHNFKAVADATDAILESDEANNVKTIPSPTTLPDLIISSITWDPATPIVNEPATFTIFVTNQGKARSPMTDLKYGFDTFYQFTAIIPDLDINQSCNITIMFTPLYPSFTVNAAVDMDNKIKEISKTNNSMVRTVGAVKPVASADLVVGGLILTPAKPFPGQTAILTLIAKNKGSGKAGASYTAIYLEGEKIATLYISPLAAGAIESKDVIIDLKGLPNKSSYSITARMDCTSIVPETDEFNNVGELVFSLSEPVLTVQSITWSPLIPNPGDLVTFDITATNAGQVTSPSVRLSYYVDNTFVGQHLLDPIAAGGSMTRQFTWKAQKMPFTFIATIDQTNSSKSITIPVPDLLIDSITWQPDSPKELDQVTFTVSISNSGKGPAAATLLYCYIDDGSPLTIKTPEIGPDSNTNVTFTYAFISGDHNLRFVPNGDGAVTESSAANNAKTIKFTVQPLNTTKAATGNTTMTSSTTPKASVASTTTAAQSVKTTPPNSTPTPTKSAAKVSASPPGWQSILMNKWLIIGVAVIGIGAIGALLLLRKKGGANKPAKAKAARVSKPAEAAKPAASNPEKK